MTIGSPDWNIRPLRPYTELAHLVITEDAVSAVWKELVTHKGEGIILGGYIESSLVVNMLASHVKLEIDEVEVFDHTYASLAALGLNTFNRYPVAITVADDVAFMYCMTFAPVFAYETGFKFYFYHATGADRLVTGRIFYADVPK